MAVAARVSSGVQAVEVTIKSDSHFVTAVITRQALAERWQVGPRQEDLLEAFQDHRDEICDEILRRSQLSGRRVLALTTLKADTRPAQTRIRSLGAYR